ncbi:MULTISPECIES: S46 family peptidase [Butyricimonas]|uniref:S46 family peptidase n=1 Tax=Butyricimonas TaxID=574697 RepID=UPI001D07E397|nr:MULTISPECIES: S46 family peptidase [Butyricimonas]MCB6970898.1 S46 family peptidase [Butyricimonas synergistica]MCG4517612.1 S46 family peptidase [Butyricimonas sp. DFI.6.44]
MRKITLCFLAFILIALPGFADEGMWIPMLLKKYNIEDMQKAGFKLTAEDIYDINQASLKDAVVGLGREGAPFQHFCTAEIVSDQGLMITNHHCAFGMIQAHSSLEHNYLRDGFWAKSLQEELMNPGTTASILVRMEDVTDKINAALNDNMSEQERAEKIKEISRKLEAEAVKGTNLQANIKPYFNGNQYFMSIFKIFRDVRLVGAPNSAIGKFGGDTDNWTWPRHTGDFSVLRIYAGPDNEPAAVSPNNVPYKPAKFFKVSARGVKEGDFTMVFGYPGTTNEYLTSYAIDQIANVEDPHKIKIRTAKLDVINAAMESDELLRIKYAAKAANVANAWKKWQGEIKGLDRFNTADNKRVLEQNFNQWAQANGKSQYIGLTDRYKELYAAREEYILAAAYAMEAGLNGAEVIGLARNIKGALEYFDKAEDKDKFKQTIKDYVTSFYKDYDPATDERILVEMLKLYNNKDLGEQWIPGVIRDIKGNNYERHAADVFKKSIFTHEERLLAFVDKLNAKTVKKLEKDPIYQMMEGIQNLRSEKINPELSRIERELVTLNRLWMAGLMEMQPDKVFYPDANSTLRIAYGKVSGYKALDAVYYTPYTTLKGIMEKDNPNIYDYDVPQKLRDLYKNRDFGPYTQDGEVPVCFIATNHTTGGNSGSPVLDAEGNLIGLNFDRAWEGVMSDMQYSPEICRNIAVDIRFVLFIIDKYAGAKHLIEEMEIIR